MNDDVYCLFVIFACILTLAIPAAAEALFAGFMFALVVAGYLANEAGSPDSPAPRARHDVAGG